MNIGLYFGSFNPIHTGHCIIASHVLANTPLEQVWLVVTPHNPFKNEQSLLNEYDRLYLVQLAIAGEGGLRGSDIEFHLNKPSYTVHTLVHLKEKYPQHDFSIIMGSDSYQNLPKWKNSGYIQGNHSIYIYTRPGFPAETGGNGKVILLDAPLLEISSTRIREYVRKKKNIRYLVPDKVQEEIEKNGYYK